MSAPRDLRGELARSEFFTRIGTGNCGDEDETQLIFANSTTLYGIDQNSDNLIQLSLAGCTNINTVCAAPIHCIDHITQASDGSLALWSALGVSVLKGPVKPGTSVIPVNIRLGQSFIKSVKWLGDHLFVLNSSNEICAFKNKNFDLAVEISFSNNSDTICDFVAVENKDGETEILTIATNGFLSVDQDILTNVEIQGDLKMSRVGKDCVVVANNQMAVHVLILHEEAFIVEKVELELFESVNAIAIIADECCLNRYFIYSNRKVFSK